MPPPLLPHRLRPRLLPFPLPPRAAAWPLALILLALFAHSPALPLPGWPALLLALASRRLAPGHWSQALRLAGLLACYLAGAWFYGWLESSTLRFTLLLILALKWAESRTEGEYSLLAGAALPAMAIGMLQWHEGIGLALALPALGLLIAARGDPGMALRAKPPHFALRDAGRHLLGALPLAAILFLFFPRIPGPLWDIGLSFGLPLPANIEKSAQGLGISARMKPGQTQTGASDGEAVLVAEFRDWVPPTSQLYWRGPVFYDFDGQEWHLDADYAAGNGRKIMSGGWRRAADFNGQLQLAAREIHYRVRLAGHGALWLYGLDLPSRLTGESFIGPDWQLLSHTPVQREVSYELSSWLEWKAGGELSPASRARALALPADSNPQLRALGAAMKSGLAAAGDADPVLRQIWEQLARGGFRVAERFAPPEETDALDAFWFESRTGNSGMYAAALTFLLRSAGIPARLVTGYRGGKLMALTDYLVVKRSHAHAWVEIWDEGQGWRRLDPVDVVAPEKFAAPAPLQKTAPKPLPAPAPAAGSAPASPAGSSKAPAGDFASTARPQTAPASSWQLPDLAVWLGRWVFRLDGAQQQKLIAGQGGGFAWLWLLAGAATGSALLFMASLLLHRWRASRRLPAAQRAWQRACRLLAKKGLPVRIGECPSVFARRVARQEPAWGLPMMQLAEAYTAWRYGSAPAEAAAIVPGAARLLINRILAA